MSYFKKINSNNDNKGIRLVLVQNVLSTKEIKTSKSMSVQ